MKRVLFIVLLLITVIGFSYPFIRHVVGDAPVEEGRQESLTRYYQYSMPSKAFNLSYDDIIKERGVYIGNLALQSQKKILQLQKDLQDILGVNGSTINKEQYEKYYCKNPESWNVDNAIAEGNIEARFTAQYKYQGKIRQFTRGYAYGGNCLSPDNRSCDPLYGIDCSSGTFADYNLGGFCIPFYSSAGFMDKRSEYVTEIPLGREQVGDIAWWSGHIAIITDVYNKWAVWNGSTASYIDYNGKTARIFRWKSTFKEVCEFGLPCKGCNITENALYRQRLYQYKEPPFCKKGKKYG